MIDQPYRADEENLRALVKRYELELGQAEARLAEKTAPTALYISLAGSVTATTALFTVLLGGPVLMASAITASIMSVFYFCARLVAAVGKRR